MERPTRRLDRINPKNILSATLGSKVGAMRAGMRSASQPSLARLMRSAVDNISSPPPARPFLKSALASPALTRPSKIRKLNPNGRVERKAMAAFGDLSALRKGNMGSKALHDRRPSTPLITDPISVDRPPGYYSQTPGGADGRIRPSMMFPSADSFSYPNQPAGYYTPTLGGVNTLYHSQAGDLQMPGKSMNVGTSLSLPPLGDPVYGQSGMDLQGSIAHPAMQTARQQHQSRRPEDEWRGCPYCSMKFHFKNLGTHMLRLHPLEKHYICATCDARFYEPDQLILHCRAHPHQQPPQIDRPFKCDQCPQSFNRNRDLEQHMRVHLAGKSPDQMNKPSTTGAGAPDSKPKMFMCYTISQDVSGNNEFNGRLRALRHRSTRLELRNSNLQGLHIRGLPSQHDGGPLKGTVIGTSMTDSDLICEMSFLTRDARSSGPGNQRRLRGRNHAAHPRGS
jgi:DNA-directed RNA polymerase subunit RPC12/RpoP